MIILLTFCPRFVKTFVTKIFPSLRKTQSINISLATYGMIKSQSGKMSEIVREFPGDFTHKSKLKRLWRFVSNPRVKPERLQSFWINWCIRRFTSGNHLLVALDWTTLPGNIQVLMTAIPFKGRAIPLLWHICLHSEIKDSQNKKEERLVARLNNLIVPSGKKLILVADRGFGRATFIQFLKAKNILFVVRVKSKVWIKVGRKTDILLKRLYLKPKTRYWFKNITFREDGIVAGINMAAVVVLPKDPFKDPDPWFLVTNLRKAQTTINAYTKRFQIEEWFRDLKHELGIANLQTKNLKRVRRLILVSAFAYSLVALVGKAAERMEKVRQKVISGGRKTASIIWLALRGIEHNLFSHQFWKKVRALGMAP